MRFLLRARDLLLSKTAATQKSMGGTETILSSKKEESAGNSTAGKLSVELYWCCVTIFSGTWLEGVLDGINVGPGAEGERKRARPLVGAVSCWCPRAYLYSLSGQITLIACEQGFSSSSH